MAVTDDLACAPLDALKGVGPALAVKLARLGLKSQQDLLFHLPLRYQDRTRVSPIGTLRHSDHAVIEGEIELADVHLGRRRSLMVRIADGSGALFLRFFYFNRAQQKAFAKGARLRAYGEVRRGAHTLEMVHPEYRLLGEGQETQVEEALTPIYPATEGVGQTQLRRLIDQMLERIRDTPPRELLPPGLLPPGLPTLAEALQLLHHPPPETSLQALEAGSHPAIQRLALEELLAHQLALRHTRHQLQALRAPLLAGDGLLVRAFLAALPFPLTGAQQRVSAEIARDLATPRPMLRLVQGDVGSGKTVVAALAALRAIESGYQAALMAPTELLAEQHFRNLSAWFEPLGLRVAWLAGSLKGRKRRDMLEHTALGTAKLVVGTHALFQPEVRFRKLGLVMVDEQHRFGVEQRLALKEKGVEDDSHPHQLTLTATPIPRTLYMTAYADLDLSIIDELPPGRTPVETVVIPEGRRMEVVARVRAQCREGRQAYWVCPLISESDVLTCQAAEETSTILAQELPELCVGLIHGRMKAAQKDAVMAEFKRGALDLLVATTVIEVGVDVPNASLMIIENAERLGLAQLHQLRGRVGRGAEKSSCVLLYAAPLSAIAKERLHVMRETNDGFVIAQRDHDLRGPGELLGTRQTGLLALKVADLQRDADLVERLATIAEGVEQRYPELVEPLQVRWIGAAERYVGV